MESVKYLIKKFVEHFMIEQVPDYFRVSPPENLATERFTEGGSVYLGKPPGSIWGLPSKLTMERVGIFFSEHNKALRRIKQFFGRDKLHTICDLGGGDGRHTPLLKSIAKIVIPLDTDPSALWKNRSDNGSGVQPVAADFTEKFPIISEGVDAVFSAATLHLFSPARFDKISKEVDRIIKPNGKLFLDWSYDINRTYIETGKPKLLIFGEERQLGCQESIDLLKKAFPNFELDFEEGDVINRSFTDVEEPYTITCKSLLVTGIKRKKSSIKFFTLLPISSLP